MNTNIAQRMVTEEGIAVNTKSHLNTEESHVVEAAGYDSLIAVISSPEREYALVEKSNSVHLLNSDNLYIDTPLSENKVVLFRDLNKNIIGSLQVEFDGAIRLSGNSRDLFVYGQESNDVAKSYATPVALAI